MVPTAFKVLLMRPIKAPPRKKLNLQKQTWLVSGQFLRGSLWGALGYALAFGLAGGLFGLLRKEVLDPRDEHLGMGMMGAFARGAVGLFYGTSMGFALGGCLVFVLRFLFPNFAVVPAPILHWVYVLGAASNPNVAFTYAFSTACLLAGGMSLFLGKRDFTAGVSDPKAPKLTRPVEIIIPAVPPPPMDHFDASRMQAESQQILQQFGAELSRTFNGAEWQYERYNDLAPIGPAGQKPEPEATNLISARTGGGDDGVETAMGSLSNVYVQIVADLGKLEISAADWLTLAEGAMLELPKAADSTVNVSINGKPVGKGRPLTVNGNKAVKVLSLKGDIKQIAGA
jgi:flagellar motor switch/type III secretory pathway protein FliN